MLNFLLVNSDPVNAMAIFLWLMHDAVWQVDMVRKRRWEAVARLLEISPVDLPIDLSVNGLAVLSSYTHKAMTPTTPIQSQLRFRAPPASDNCQRLEYLSRWEDYTFAMTRKCIISITAFSFMGEMIIVAWLPIWIKEDEIVSMANKDKNPYSRTSIRKWIASYSHQHAQQLSESKRKPFERTGYLPEDDAWCGLARGYKY